MIGVNVYHHIKALRRDYSLRDTADRAGVSVNTVRKYEGMSLTEASHYLAGVKRRSQFEVAKPFVEARLRQFPKISAVKLLRQVKERYPDICGKARSFRNWLKPIRAAIKPEVSRRYEPILDLAPGQQLQVDPGEATVQIDSEQTLKVYFVAFVLSYSRCKFVVFQDRPFQTADFIKAHVQAFAYFGGAPREAVYDQTKLVVISERYREVVLNEAFGHFALGCGFEVRACEGYDPESKGKVERVVSQVKSDFLYGEYFRDVDDITIRSRQWLDEIANGQAHTVTGRPPVEMLVEEQPLFSQQYTLVDGNKRLVDKTGLLSFEGNKYSAPSAWQQREVLVNVMAGQLIVNDPDTGAEIARHTIPAITGQVIKNKAHYRDLKKSLAERIAEATTALSDVAHADELIARIVADNPNHTRDQVRALKRFAGRFEADSWQAAMPLILRLPQLSATRIESILSDYQRTRQAQNVSQQAVNPQQPASCLDRPLERYMEVVAC